MKVVIHSVCQILVDVSKIIIVSNQGESHVARCPHLYGMELVNNVLVSFLQ